MIVSEVGVRVDVTYWWTLWRSGRYEEVYASRQSALRIRCHVRISQDDDMQHAGVSKVSYGRSTYLPVLTCMPFLDIDNHDTTVCDSVTLHPT